MKTKRFIMVASLGIGLIGFGGSAVAQDPGGAVINADGSNGASNAGINPAVDADGPTVVYGDLNPGPGNTVIGVPPPSSSSSFPGADGNITATDGNAAALGPGNATAAPGTVTRGGSSGTDLLGPDGTYSVTEVTPSTVSTGDSGALAPAPEPIYEPVAEPVVSEPVASGIPGDADGDNLLDTDEAALGLDPYNPDADGDGVADGDEVNIYGTDPWNWDTDGDGLGDGVELFDTRTDPLVWNGDGAAASGGNQSAAAAEPLAAEATASGNTGADSDGDRLPDVDEAALGTDPGNPDSDGDGYYDGDEAALGASPHDPASFPAT